MQKQKDASKGDSKLRKTNILKINLQIVSQSTDGAKDLPNTTYAFIRTIL